MTLARDERKQAAPKKPHFDFPDLGIGVGLRTQHFGHILQQQPEVEFFEAISENFMDTGGRPISILDQIAERYPIVLHGVSLSIGSSDPLDRGYLARLKKLVARVKAPWASDHLCWTGVAGRNSHDLLPIPYTEESLRHVVARVKAVQDILERPFVLENPSTYVEFKESTFSDAQFLASVAEEADCGILLDVNNVYVSSYNHGFDPVEYLHTIPHERVVQYHLAGHSNHGTHIVDTHDDHVVEPVWELYRLSHQLSGGRATLLEWDDSIPDFDTVHAEALKAKQYRKAPAKATRPARANARSKAQAARAH